MHKKLQDAINFSLSSFPLKICKVQLLIQEQIKLTTEFQLLKKVWDKVNSWRNQEL